MKIDIKPCSSCGITLPIVNKTHCLCGNCNYKRLHGGKSKYDVAREKVRKKKARKATGEWALFMEIWTERPHKCVRCGLDLGSEPKAVYFSHIRSKGAHPELRLVKSNIELLCERCHHKHEFAENLI